MLEGRLRQRVRDTGAANLRITAACLFERDGLRAEAVHLIDAVTTNKTDFFREPEHFRILVRAGAADVAGGPPRRRQAQSSCGVPPAPPGRRPTRSRWCWPTGASSDAACASRSWAPISPPRCSTLRSAGVYPEAMVAAVPPEFRQPLPAARPRAQSRKLVRIVPELRALVRSCG